MSINSLQVNKIGGKKNLREALGFKQIDHLATTRFSRRSILVVSAAGDTTGDLIEIINAYGANDMNRVIETVRKIKSFHFGLLLSLSFPQKHKVFDKINERFSYLEDCLYHHSITSLDMLYGQIVSLGEEFSSIIISHYLDLHGHRNLLLSATDFIITDNNFREASVKMDETEKAFAKIFTKDLLADNRLIITQGFIGKTIDGMTTLLGLEGSDYTAAIAAYCLNAKEVNYYKDVPGVMTADPKDDPNAKLLLDLSHVDFGKLQKEGKIKKLLHEKSLAPLAEKNIPFSIRPFYEPKEAGTRVETKIR